MSLIDDDRFHLEDGQLKKGRGLRAYAKWLVIPVAFTIAALLFSGTPEPLQRQGDLHQALADTKELGRWLREDFNPLQERVQARSMKHAVLIEEHQRQHKDIQALVESLGEDETSFAQHLTKANIKKAFDDANKLKKGNVDADDEVVTSLIKPEDIEKGFTTLRSVIDKVAAQPEGFDVTHLDKAALKIALSFHTFAELLERCLVLAKTTQGRTKRSLRNGKLIQKMQERDNEAGEVKVWRRLLKTTATDIKNSEERTVAILDELKVLGENLGDIKGEFKAAADALKDKVEKEMERQAQAAKDAELARIKNKTKCTWWMIIFTAGVACIVTAIMRKVAIDKLDKAGVKYVGALDKLSKEFAENDKVFGMTEKLQKLVGGQKQMMDEFKVSLQDVLKTVEENRDEMVEMFADPDFGEELIAVQFADWQTLIDECDAVIKNTLARRDQMLKILNGKA